MDVTASVESSSFRTMNDEAALEPDLALFLESFWGAFTEAESAGDFSAVAPMCADDLVFQSQGFEPYRSLESLIDSWWTPPEDYRIVFERGGVVCTQEIAVDWGIASDSFRSTDGDTGGNRYNYLAVFGKSDGEWSMTHFSSNLIG
jgi:hypothetical protein